MGHAANAALIVANILTIVLYQTKAEA